MKKILRGGKDAKKPGKDAKAAEAEPAKPETTTSKGSLRKNSTTGADQRVTMAGTPSGGAARDFGGGAQQPNRYTTQPGSSSASGSAPPPIPGSYVTAHPRKNAPGTPPTSVVAPMQPEPPRIVTSEYTVPSNIATMVMQPPQQNAPGMVVSEYTIPTSIPEQMSPEARWKSDWFKLGPHPEMGCVRHEQLLQFFGNVPDAFKGVLFELTGDWVTQDRFRELLAGFGPFEELVANICTIFSQRWFYNFMRAEEAARWLSNEPPGSFLVRFADPSSLSAFMVCYVKVMPTGAVGVVQERVVSNFPAPGFVYESPSGAIPCSSLFQVLDTIHSHTPLVLFQNPLADEIWFHGGISADEATELLRTRPAGTFLVRFSTQQFSYTISQIVEDQQFISVTHTRLLQTPDGWYRDASTGKSWPTLENFLHLAGLNIPLVNRIPMIRKLGAQLSLPPPFDGGGGGGDGGAVPPPTLGPVFVE